MLQRDYIQRLIREFMAALERMLEKKEVEVRREKIRDCLLYTSLSLSDSPRSKYQSTLSDGHNPIRCGI